MEALNLDTACISLLEQTEEHGEFIQAKTPKTIYSTIRIIGDMLNVKQRADQLAENLEERINIITHKLKFIADEHKPKVLCINGVSPMTIAHNEYIDNLVSIAGGINYFDAPSDKLNPDLLIIISSQPMPQLLDELPAALSNREWSETQAVKNNNVYVIHNSKFLHQPGATIADDIEILAEIINPRQFFFGRNEDVWMQFSLN
ncbi:ABC transporter substrate-binding protein [Parapedobacter tibetensis]|uniref:ABC transporter substrate-binding protein n=1 Tax=Parapedobacter tibetensis TaxID=2972951 RepID=UPI00214D42FF|nr:ABC transporter substrate-binding protein [Parapedobacter tibetensis]